jgi:hypothetical protein
MFFNTACAKRLETSNFRCHVVSLDVEVDATLGRPPLRNSLELHMEAGDVLLEHTVVVFGSIQASGVDPESGTPKREVGFQIVAVDDEVADATAMHGRYSD